MSIIQAFPAGGGSAEYPAGGTKGQALVKNSNADNDVKWGDISGEGHTIQDNSGVGLPQRKNLKIVGASTTDDSENDSTIITIDLDSKANKVQNATNNNLAGLDANGNLKDSGIASTNVVTKSQTAGLLKNDGTVDETQYISDVSGKEDKFRYTTMPTASASNLGKVVQYLGESTQTYAQGNSYKCVLDGSTYKWVVFGGVKDNRIGDEINNIKVRIDDGFRPYFTVNLETVIPPFENATWDEIASVVNSYYSGDISLDDIKTVWNIGDTKDITLPAMAAAYTSESHARQTIKLHIADFEHDNLVTTINGKTKSFITFSFLINENGQMRTNGSDSGSSSGNEGGWQACQRRSWCNNTCYNALPSGLKTLVKPVYRVTDKGSCSQESNTTNDKLFLVSCKDIAGATKLPSGFDAVSSGIDNGVQYELYKKGYYPTKVVYTTTTMGGHKPGWGSNYYSSYWIGLSSTFAGGYYLGNTAHGLLIHGCI